MNAPILTELPSLRPVLSLREQMRLAGILGRLSSPFAGERSAAALLASEFMDRHGLSWTDFVSMGHEAPPAPAPVPQTERRAVSSDRRRGVYGLYKGYNRRKPCETGLAVSYLT